MAFPRKLLNEGEELVLDLNPHWIFLAPSVTGLIAAIVLGLLVRFGWDPGGTPGKIVYVLVAVLILAALVYFLSKLAVWKTTQFVVTNTRLISGHGVISKNRKEIPLDRVNDVSFHQSILERLVGAGDLTIESAGERGQQTFYDVNHPDRVQQHIYRQMEAREQRRFTTQPPLTQYAPPTAPAPPAQPATPSVADQIDQLHDLMQRGVISPAEFEAKKAELLRRL